jgi:MFS family permease
MYIKTSTTTTTKLKLLNMLENSSLSSVSIFVPILANMLTNSYLMVGVIASAYGLAQALSYVYFGRQSDKHGNMVMLVRLGFLASAASFYMHVLAYDGLTLLLLRVSAGVATGIYAGALLSLAHSKGNNSGLAGVTSFGSLGWLIGSLSSGIIQYASNNYNLAFISAGSMFLLGFILSLRLNTSNNDDKTCIDAYHNSDNYSGVTRVNDSILHLLKRNSAVYSTFMLRHLGASMTWSIFPIFLHDELKLSSIEIGSIYAINALAQFIFMGKVMGRIVNRHNINPMLLQLGTMLSALVFILYYFATSYLYMIAVQVILGVSWSLLYLGSLINLFNNSNGSKASAGSLLESIISIAVIVGSMLGGMVAELFGLRSVMLASFILNVCAFVITVVSRFKISVGVSMLNGIVRRLLVLVKVQ